MSAASRRPLSALSVWVALLASPPAAVGQADSLIPAPFKPTWAKRVEVKPWETASTAPWGWSRMGGSDQRRFAFSPDGKLLATEDAGGWQIELWDVQSGKSLGKFGRIDDPVALAFAPDGSRLVTAGQDFHRPCAVEVWDLRTRGRPRSLDEDVNATPFHAVAWSPDGKALALGGGESRRSRGAAIVLWDAEAGEELLRFDAPTRPPDVP